jgi:hypothetical protein
MRVFSFRDRRPLTKLELIIVVLVACLVAVVVLWRVDRLAASAERMAMIWTVKNLRQAVTLKALKHTLHGDEAAIKAMPGSNPMRYTQPPSTYLGELDPADIPPQHKGVWYFDLDKSILVYRVKSTRYFTSNATPPNTAIFAVQWPQERQQGLPECVALMEYQWNDVLQ